MKLLLDENLSPKLAISLSDLYPDSAHVRNLALARSDDLTVWKNAKANGFAIVSKDSDFEQFSLLWGYPPKVIRVRLGNSSTGQVEELLRSHSVIIHTFNEDPMESLLLLP